MVEADGFDVACFEEFDGFLGPVYPCITGRGGTKVVEEDFDFRIFQACSLIPYL